MNQENYVGFNSDATRANRLHIECIESEFACGLCDHTISKNQLAISQPFCPYNRVKIGGVVYKRNRNFNHESSDMDYRCPGCDVTVGFVHHIGCIHDACPRCGGYNLEFYECTCRSEKEYIIENDCIGEIEVNYEDYAVRPSTEFISDATTADELHIERVASRYACERCHHDKNPHPYHEIRDRDIEIFNVINPVYCPFNLVKIDGVVYKRNRSPRHNANLDFVTDKQLKKMREIYGADRKCIPHGDRCDSCGVPNWFVHHIGCRNETCPKCKRDMNGTSNHNYRMLDCQCSEKEYIMENIN